MVTEERPAPASQDTGVGQTRGFIDLRDTVRCVELALLHPSAPGEMRVMNQFTEQFPVRALAERVCRVARASGLTATITHIENPRTEREDHYYQAKHTALRDLGLEPHLLTDDTIAGLLETDAALFQPGRRSESWRRRLTNGHPAATILLSVGRLAPEKGLAHLLAAVPHLPPGCHVVFVGDGPAATALRHAARGLPVTFPGTLVGEDLAAAYAAADIFVLPSTTETLGLVAIEAMAAGTPVVGARRGGILDIIVDGETGLFFDPDTPGGGAIRAYARRPYPGLVSLPRQLHGPAALACRIHRAMCPV